MSNTTKFRKEREALEQQVLEAYNKHRKRTGQSPTETYVEVGRKLGGLNIYQVQYIIIKARKAGKEVL